MPDATMDSGIDGPMTDMAPAGDDGRRRGADAHRRSRLQAVGGLPCRCSDPDCSLACRRAAPVDSTALYDAIFACGSANACNAEGGGYDPQCLAMHCAAEQEACLGPPPPPPRSPWVISAVVNSRIAWLNVLQGIQIAEITVWPSASPTGYEQLVALQTCVSDTACAEGDSACVVRTCQNEIRTCFGSVIVPMGTDDCRALNTCLGECVDGDQPCIDNCFIGSSDEGYNAFQDLSRCVRGSNCPPGDGDCQRDACGPEFESCFGPPAPHPWAIWTAPD